MLPIHLRVKFYSALRPGIGTIHGRSQEITWKWDGPFELKFLECQTVQAQNKLVTEDDYTQEMLCSKNLRNIVNLTFPKMFDKRIKTNL